MGLDRELGFMKELTRLRLRISALEAALKAALAECEAWRLVDSESRDQHPCPDLALRAEYRRKARLKKEATDAARKEAGL